MKQEDIGKRFDKLDKAIAKNSKLTEHNEPSQKTMAMFTDLDEKIDGLVSAIKELSEQSDKKFAIKLVERVVFGMIGLILLAFFGVITKSVFK